MAAEGAATAPPAPLGEARACAGMPPTLPATAELPVFLVFFSCTYRKAAALGWRVRIGAGAGPLAGMRVHRSLGASSSRGSSSVLFRARAKPAAVLSRASSGSAGVFSLAAEQSTLVRRGGRRLWGKPLPRSALLLTVLGLGLGQSPFCVLRFASKILLCFLCDSSSNPSPFRSTL